MKVYAWFVVNSCGSNKVTDKSILIIKFYRYVQS